MSQVGESENHSSEMEPNVESNVEAIGNLIADVFVQKLINQGEKKKDTKHDHLKHKSKKHHKIHKKDKEKEQSKTKEKNSKHSKEQQTKDNENVIDKSDNSSLINNINELDGKEHVPNDDIDSGLENLLSQALGKRVESGVEEGEIEPEDGEISDTEDKSNSKKKKKKQKDTRPKSCDDERSKVTNRDYNEQLRMKEKRQDEYDYEKRRSDYSKKRHDYESSELLHDHEDYYYGSYREENKSRHSYHERRSSHRSRSPVYRDKHYLNREFDRRRSLSPSPSYDHRRRSRSRSVSRSIDRIDKERLRTIARENLMKMIEKGDLPKGTDINNLKLRHLRELTTQKSVRQWTEFCRAISALDSAHYSDSDSDFDSDDDTRSVSSEYLPSLHHPFKIKERKEIQFNVRNFVQLPARSSQELAIEIREQFPVSSGSQHRRKELEWQEVQEMPPPPVPPPKKPKKDKKASESSSQPVSEPYVSETTKDTANESVFPQPDMSIDIGTVMSQRLNAMRKLQEDPYNCVALKQLHQAQEMMQEWAESKIVPGQFTGSTGANVYTGDVLSAGAQAWTRKDQLKTAAPLEGGIGMHLLKKMGWLPGQGLGRKNEGPIEPLMLDIKFDKKGLVAEEETIKNLPLQLVSIQDGPGKHPVSMVQELCAKRKWDLPTYDLVSEEGPDHRKNFVFKVIVNGVEYQPSISSSNKKQAKALAATVFLQAFGLLPKSE